MAVILNIETATSVCSVALAENGKLLAFEESNESNVHAEKLAVFIQNLLKKTSRSYSELNAIAIGSGPGSYTGLRIGTSTAKGLCYGLNIPLIAVSTLKAMAHAAAEISTDKNALLCPMIDARRLEVYTALYDSNGKEVEPVYAKILDENSFAEYRAKSSVAFFGDGMPKMRELLAPLNPHGSVDTKTIWIDSICASAKNLAPLAEEAYNANRFTDLAYYQPFYLKDFIAKKPAKKLF